MTQNGDGIVATAIKARRFETVKYLIDNGARTPVLEVRILSRRCDYDKHL